MFWMKLRPRYRGSCDNEKKNVEGLYQYLGHCQRHQNNDAILKWLSFINRVLKGESDILWICHKDSDYDWFDLIYLLEDLVFYPQNQNSNST